MFSLTLCWGFTLLSLSVRTFSGTLSVCLYAQLLPTLTDSDLTCSLIPGEYDSVRARVWGRQWLMRSVDNYGPGAPLDSEEQYGQHNLDTLLNPISYSDESGWVR